MNNRYKYRDIAGNSIIVSAKSFDEAKEKALRQSRTNKVFFVKFM